MAEINWTVEAEHWLKDIHDYISQDKPSVADRVVNEIFEKVQILHEFPEAGYQYHTKLGENIRILLYGHYRIAYLIKDNNQIDILGVFHGALDIDRYLI